MRDEFSDKADEFGKAFEGRKFRFDIINPLTGELLVPANIKIIRNHLRKMAKAETLEFMLIETL